MAAKVKRIGQILAALDHRCPQGTAESWDNVGLLVGDADLESSGAVVSVDLTLESIRLAEEQGVSLILNHHPCIFPKGRGLSRLTGSEPGSLASLILKAASKNIAVAAYHTNFDRCALDVINQVSAALKVRARGRLHDEGAGSLVKLAVFVPQTHLEAVRSAVCAAGAGHIGNYDHCSFGVPGEGTFRGGGGTQPFIGMPGILERTEEVRLETVFPKGLQAAVLQALTAAHPYEEVAFDLYPVLQRPVRDGLVRGLGYGFWGEFDHPKVFSELAQDVKAIFNLNGFWLTEPPLRKASSKDSAMNLMTRPLKRVAFVPGKGASFVDSAIAAECDVFITGETGYHVALDAARRGMAVMELGHRESERFFLTTVGDWLTADGLKATVVDLPTQRFWAE